jgi:predicted GIY-YIG superfamily endonuclease
MNAMNICGYIFTGPYNPDQGFNEKISATYAVHDNYKILDVGQTDDLNNRFPNHDRRNCWERHKTGQIKLYIFIENNKQKRLFIERQIRVTLKPVCGSF